MNEGFVLAQLEQRRGAGALLSELRKRYRDDIDDIQCAGNIAQALSVDLLALVLGTYGYRAAAKLSRVCKKFRDAVRRVQFWQRGIKVELRSFLQGRAIPASAIAMMMCDFDPYHNSNGETITIRMACAWIFSKRAACDINAVYSTRLDERAVLGIGFRIRFLWKLTKNSFSIAMGPYNSRYGRIHGCTYHQRRVHKHGVLVNTDKIFIEP